MFAAQEQALRTWFFRAIIEKEDVDPRCWGCGKEVECHSDIVFCPGYRLLSLISFFVPDIVFCPARNIQDG